MRLISFSSPLGPRIGAIVGENVIDLNAAYGRYLSDQGAPRSQERANVELPANAVSFIEEGSEAIERAGKAIDFAQTGLGTYVIPLNEIERSTPIPKPPKVLCLGLNYVDHAAEASMKVPDYPVIFGKYASSLIGPDDTIQIPHVSDHIDYEGEMCVVIGKRGRYVSESDAMQYVFGYTIMNDVSIRDYQMRTSQWTAGKMFDRLTPIGPELVTADEISNPHALELEVTINGEVLQKANTRQMMFKIPKIISYISEICELEPGDIIATGTPAGVGFTRQPPLFLQDGDVVTVRISQLGELTNRVCKNNR